jgi:hypothetical protein
MLKILYILYEAHPTSKTGKKLAKFTYEVGEITNTVVWACVIHINGQR